MRCVLHVHAALSLFHLLAPAPRLPAAVGSDGRPSLRPTPRSTPTHRTMPTNGEQLLAFKAHEYLDSRWAVGQCKLRCGGEQQAQHRRIFSCREVWAAGHLRVSGYAVTTGSGTNLTPAAGCRGITAVVPVATPNDTSEPQLLCMSPEQVRRKALGHVHRQ